MKKTTLAAILFFPVLSFAFNSPCQPSSGVAVCEQGFYDESQYITGPSINYIFKLNGNSIQFCGSYQGRGHINFIDSRKILISDGYEFNGDITVDTATAIIFVCNGANVNAPINFVGGRGVVYVDNNSHVGTVNGGHIVRVA